MEGRVGGIFLKASKRLFYGKAANSGCFRFLYIKVLNSITKSKGLILFVRCDY